MGYNTVSVLTLLTGWSVIRARQTSSKPELHASPATARRQAATRTQKRDIKQYKESASASQG